MAHLRIVCWEICQQQARCRDECRGGKSREISARATLPHHHDRQPTWVKRVQPDEEIDCSGSAVAVLQSRRSGASFDPLRKASVTESLRRSDQLENQVSGSIV